jgi:hypothetical protein
MQPTIMPAHHPTPVAMHAHSRTLAVAQEMTMPLALPSLSAPANAMWICSGGAVPASATAHSDRRPTTRAIAFTLLTGGEDYESAHRPARHPHWAAQTTSFRMAGNTTPVTDMLYEVRPGRSIRLRLEGFHPEVLVRPAVATLPTPGFPQAGSPPPTTATAPGLPLVFFVHGSCANLGQFDRQHAWCRAHGIPFVAYDAVGCGEVCGCSLPYDGGGDDGGGGGRGPRGATC